MSSNKDGQSPKFDLHCKFFQRPHFVFNVVQRYYTRSRNFGFSWKKVSKYYVEKIVATRVLDVKDCHWNFSVLLIIKNVWSTYGFGESNGDVFEAHMDDCYGMYHASVLLRILNIIEVDITENSKQS